MPGHPQDNCQVIQKWQRGLSKWKGLLHLPAARPLIAIRELKFHNRHRFLPPLSRRRCPDADNQCQSFVSYLPLLKPRMLESEDPLGTDRCTPVVFSGLDLSDRSLRYNYPNLIPKDEWGHGKFLLSDLYGSPGNPDNTSPRVGKVCYRLQSNGFRDS